ncbi:hypothetical protein OIU79_000610 [Salix purpurea]|uniref:Uncharacterized protein n=1 Tax=Salix purpurea TaxID=77065 RepID=A0A9Q0V1Q9_SALPP|nr:hypothetical protein OIU79_000610 [Salix purpurea]
MLHNTRNQFPSLWTFIVIGVLDDASSTLKLDCSEKLHITRQPRLKFMGPTIFYAVTWTQRVGAADSQPSCPGMDGTGPTRNSVRDFDMHADCPPIIIPAPQQAVTVFLKPKN